MKEESSSSIDEIAFFPWIATGVGRDEKSAVRDLIVMAWTFNFLRTVIEDCDGADGRDEYVAGLVFEFVDCLVRLDSALAGRALPNRMHRLALSMENGLSDLASLRGAELMEHLLRRDPTAEGTQIERLQKFWAALLAGFPGKFPDLTEPGQIHRQALRSLRDWSTLCRVADVEDGFISQFTL